MSKSKWDFRVNRIKASVPPSPDSAGTWYEYEIANHITTITGTRKGSKREVQDYVRYCVNRLNNRHQTQYKVNG